MDFQSADCYQPYTDLRACISLFMLIATVVDHLCAAYLSQSVERLLRKCRGRGFELHRGQTFYSKSKRNFSSILNIIYMGLHVLQSFSNQRYSSFAAYVVTAIQYRFHDIYSKKFVLDNYATSAIFF